MKKNSIWQPERQTIKSVKQDIKDLKDAGYTVITGCWRCYPDYVCECPEPTKLEGLQSTRFLTMTYGRPKTKKIGASHD